MNDTCCCTKNQALLTTEEAALYLGVPVSYLICARSPKCPGCLVPPPQIRKASCGEKGCEMGTVSQDRARQMACLAPATRKNGDSENG